MLQINLSTLNGAELRRLLDASRQRGDAALSYQVLQEMAERRDARPGGRRKDAEPRLAMVATDEPQVDDAAPPMPAWRPPEAEAAHEPPVILAQTPMSSRPYGGQAAATPQEPLPSLSLGPDASETPHAAAPDDLDLRMDAQGRPSPPKAPPPSRPPRRSGGAIGLGLVTGFAVGAAIGLGLGWWSGGILREPRDTATPVQVATAAPPAPAAAAEPAATPPTPPDFATPQSATDQTAAAPVAAQPVTAPEDTKTAEAPTSANPKLAEQPPARPGDDADRPAPTSVSAPIATKVGDCAAQPTPADRTICGDPALKTLQRDLQRAYAAALAAHADKATLRERQLAWRDARSNVSEPEKLTELYQERIRKLNAASAEARAAK